MTALDGRLRSACRPALLALVSTLVLSSCSNGVMLGNNDGSDVIGVWVRADDAFAIALFYGGGGYLVDGSESSAHGITWTIIEDPADEPFYPRRMVGEEKYRRKYLSIRMDTTSQSPTLIDIEGVFAYQFMNEAKTELELDSVEFDRTPWLMRLNT